MIQFALFLAMLKICIHRKHWCWNKCPISLSLKEPVLPTSLPQRIWPKEIPFLSVVFIPHLWHTLFCSSFLFWILYFPSPSILNRVLLHYAKVTLAPCGSNLNFWLSNRYKQIINDVHKIYSLIFIILSLGSFYQFFPILVAYQNFL